MKRKNLFFNNIPKYKKKISLYFKFNNNLLDFSTILPKMSLVMPVGGSYVSGVQGQALNSPSAVSHLSGMNSSVRYKYWLVNNDDSQIDFSIVICVKPYDTTVASVIFGNQEWGTSAVPQYTMSITNTGLLHFVKYQTKSIKQVFTCPISLNVNAFNHVVLTIDKFDNAYFYLNGVKNIAIKTVTDEYTGMKGNNLDKFRIFGHNTSPGFNGDLDELAIIKDYIISDFEASSLWNNGNVKTLL